MDNLNTAFDHIKTCAPPPLANQPVAVEPPTPPPMPTYGPIKRIDNLDIRDMAPWLLPKLNLRYRHVTTRSYGGWLSAFSGNNEACLVRNNGAAGLASIVYEPCEATPRAKIVWVYTKEGQAQAGVAICAHFLQWAKLNKCDMMMWDTRLPMSSDPAMLDVTNEMLKKAFPSVITLSPRVVLI